TDYSLLDGASKIDRLVDETVRQGQKAVAITDHGYLFGAYEFYRAAKNAGIKPIVGIEAYVTPGTSRHDRTRQQWGTREQQHAAAPRQQGVRSGATACDRAAKNAGIKPSVGTAAYVPPRTSRHDRTRQQWGTREQQLAGDDVSARGAYPHLTLLSRTTAGMHNLFRLGSYASLEGQMGKWPRMDRELLSRYADGLIATSGCPSGEVNARRRLGQFDEAVKAAGEY